MHAETARSEARAARRDAKAASAQESPASMQIFVRCNTRKTLTLKINDADTIDLVKLMIQDKEGSPPDRFYLTYGGKHLAGSRLVSDYNISKDCTITMRMRLLSMQMYHDMRFLSMQCDAE